LEHYFSLLEAKGNCTRKTEVIKIHCRSHEDVNRRLEATQSKRPTAEDFGLPESTLRKKLNRETVPTSLDRFKTAFSNEEEK
jgi:hypothetical protein